MITLPANDQLVKNLFKTESSIKTGVGCTIEYNLNSMVNFATDAITNSSAEYTSGGRSPFKKLFPVDAIVRQNRPLGAGIKYYINESEPAWSTEALRTEKISDPKVMLFDKQYRTYIPSEDNYYKYWVSKYGEGANISIKYPKTLLVNKITIKFEISHCIPAAFQVFGRNGNGSFGNPLISGGSANIKSFTDKYQAGQVNMYYTGSAWSFNEADLRISEYALLTDVKLVVTGVAEKYISVIEVAPKMVKDISDDVVNFSIRKESSSTGDLLPVGNVSSNSMSLSINGYGESTPTYTIFDKTNGSFESDKKYFYKNSQINLFLKVYPYPDSDQYIKVPQGVFFMQDWSISEFGEIEINALDSCKILMDTMCPDILLKDYSVPAIIRVLLDTVGFTNYQFNTTSSATENGIVTPKYWWTEDVKTVWEAIQELCRDIQMTAVMDENNVLQFYTRDYFYGEQREVDGQGVAANNIISWEFSNKPFPDLSGLNNQANIIELNKEAMPAANKVKVLWSAATTSNYLGDSTPLWKSETTFLGALVLYNNIDANTQYGVPADPFNGKYYLTLKPNRVSYYENTQALLSYSGYLLIDSEVFEYDAIEFVYTGVEDGKVYRQDVQTPNDIYKYRSLAKASSKDFRPSYRYRIKSRAALNTKKAKHTGLSTDFLSILDWKSIGVNW